MSSRRRNLDTTLFGAKDTPETPPVVSSGDMSSESSPVGLKRASFDVRPDQIASLGVLKYRTGKRIRDLVQEALDDLIAKYER